MSKEGLIEIPSQHFNTASAALSVEENFAHIEKEPTVAVWESLMRKKVQFESVRQFDEPLRVEGEKSFSPVEVDSADVDVAIDKILQMWHLSQKNELGKKETVTFDEIKKYLSRVDTENFVLAKHLFSLQPDPDIYRQPEKEKWVMVPTELIVSTQSGEMNDGNGWHNFYENRKQNVVDMANGLLQNPKQTMERMFGNGSRSFFVRLQEIQGPAGPIYVAHDGSHRVGVAKALNVPFVLAKVTPTKSGNFLDGVSRAELWQEMINMDVVRGVVTLDETGANARLDVSDVNTDMSYPWVASSGAAFVSHQYKKLYPHALDSVRSVGGGILPDVVVKAIN